MARHNFRESVKAALRERVAHRCSNPDCRVPTAAPGEGAAGVVRGGDAAHITAASLKGPRYDKAMLAEKRSSIENGIWLCVVCARKIDHDPDAYPVDLLHGWKALAEAAAERELGKPLVAQATAMQDEILAKLNAIQADLAKRNAPSQVDVEPLDHLLQALRRLVDSGEARGLATMRLSTDGRYAEAAAEAMRLAEDETNAATHIGRAAKEARTRAAARWLDAGDIAFVSSHQQAMDAYEKCTEIDPSNLYGWGRLGGAAWWVGCLDKALHAFTQLWHMMPEGVEILLRAHDPDSIQHARFVIDHPDVSRHTYTWVIRNILIAGLNIIEILRQEPSLISNWVFRLAPIDRLSEQRMPTESEAAQIVDFFSARVYNLGTAIGVNAAQTEHCRVLESLARMASQLDQLDQAEEYLQRALAMNVEQRDFVAEAVYLCDLGVVAGIRKQPNTAREYFSQALAICAGDPKQGRLLMGVQLVSLEEAERRRRRHEQQVAAGTVNTSPAEDEIEICNLLSDEFNSDSIAAGKRAIKLKETEGNAHGNLAKIAFAEGNIDLARHEFEISIAIHDSIGHTDGAKLSRNALSHLNSHPGNPHA